MLNYVGQIRHAIDQHSEQIKHAGDAVFITSGLVTSLAYLLEKLVNPVLTALVLIATLVWTYYRVREIQGRLGSSKEKKGR